MPLSSATQNRPTARGWRRFPTPRREADPVIPILGLPAGVLLGLFFDPTVPLWLQPYLRIAVVAALDAVFGGFRARLDGIFDAKVFVISFVSNVVIAALIVFLGDQLGVGAQLSTAVVVVLGIRIFGNAAAIRRPRGTTTPSQDPRTTARCPTRSGRRRLRRLPPGARRRGPPGPSTPSRR